MAFDFKIPITNMVSIKNKNLLGTPPIQGIRYGKG